MMNLFLIWVGARDGGCMRARLADDIGGSVGG